MIAIQNEPLAVPSYKPLDLDFKLYLVTDRHQTDGRPLMEVVTDALKGGVKAIQLREKDLGTKELLKLAYRLREVTLKYDARLFINDRIEIAIAVDADGVHLGQKSMPPFAVRRLQSRLIVGVSTHSAEEALRAERSGADFITLGPVYPTSSKLVYGDPVGVVTLKEVAAKVNLPVFAIGGVKLENLEELMNSGASGVALISGVLTAKNVRATAGKLVRTLG